MTAFLIILPMLVLLAAGINKALAGSGLQGTKNKFAKLGTIAGAARPSYRRGRAAVVHQRPARRQDAAAVAAHKPGGGLPHRAAV